MNCLFRRGGNNVSRMAVAAVFCATLALSAAAWAQSNPYGYGANPAYLQGAPGYYGGGWVTPAQGYCPCPPGVMAPSPDGQYAPVPQPAPVDGEAEGGDSTTTDVPEVIADDYLPEVADLTGDAGLASAPQTAVPNAIGDSFGPCGLLTVTSGLNAYELGICRVGGTYKATHNNSPVPWTRFIYNFYDYNNAIYADFNGNAQRLDVQTHEIGYEYAFYCNLMSVQLNVPFSNTVDSTIVQDMFTTVPEEVELGNVSLALKAVVYQDCYKTLSVGAGISAPTADDIIVRDSDTEFFMNNETIVVSPYVGWVAELSPNVFTQGFIQTSVPLGNNDGRVNFLTVPDSESFAIRELRQLYIDLSLGAWIYRDECTGNGFAAIGELHYTTALEDPKSIDIDDGMARSVMFSYGRRDIIDSTLGVMFRYHRTDATMAYVLPITDEEDRLFAGELMLQVSRKF